MLKTCAVDYGAPEPAFSLVSKDFHLPGRSGRGLSGKGPAALVVDMERERRHDHIGAALQHGLQNAPTRVVEDLVPAL